ncbi:MAG: T9SS type A sorting domain-containing protein [Flavobacteriales bacterium]|nr:T9SS type A sorting domain-containing protein [Flavobacteriales bacterium]
MFPVIGDTLYYAFGNQPNAINAVLTPPGGGQVWDLSGLQADSTWQAIYHDPATGMGAADFPGAALMLAPADAMPGQEDYLSVSGTQVSHMGSHGSDPIQLGSSWTVHWNPPIPESWAPVNFFDIQQSSCSSITHFLPDEMPPGWTDQYPTVDSMRVRGMVTTLSTVDAWGTTTIPGGSYAVLRVKRTRYTTNWLDAKVNPIGWIDVTDMAIAQFGMGAVLTTDTNRTFHFINDQSKETIAIVTYYEDVLGNPPPYVLNVQYKVADFATATGSASATADRVRVYPNPATDRIQIQAPCLGHGMVELFVVDALGRQVMHRRGATGADGFPLELDITSLEAGMYGGLINRDTGDPLPFQFVKR